jgi:hypothetical protein
MMDSTKLAVVCFMALAAACGGKTNVTGDTHNSGDRGGGGTGGPCSITSGTYTQHFKAEAGGTNCLALPDQTITLNGSETFSGNSGSSPANGGQGCTTNVNASTCTYTTSCVTAVSGFTTNFFTTLTFKGSSATGKSTISSTDSTGNVLSSCTYDITMTEN